MNPVKKYSLSDFDYSLPNNLIAKYPARPRDSSRLFVVDTKKNVFYHDSFFNLDKYLSPHSLLVVNNTKVFHARLIAIREKDSKSFEFLLLHSSKKNHLIWNVLVSSLKRLKTGDLFKTTKNNFHFRFLARKDDEGIIEFLEGNDPFDAMEKEGMPPLPPYIDRDTTKKDISYYQTIYAKESGSSAAPTAGLHFTNRVFEKLENRKNIKTTFVTLHVGRGTFSPVRNEKLEMHNMHSEFYTASKEACNRLNHQLKNNKDIISVGTTSLRTLETIFNSNKNTFTPKAGETDIFIHPPMKIKSCNHMLTNFHLPKSTLLMLVCSFGGYDLIMKAYREAVKMKYRFYSYGDAMLILR